MGDTATDAGYWTASTVMQVPAETFSPVAMTGMGLLHLATFALLCVGLWFSWKRIPSKAVRAYASGLAIGALAVGTTLAVRSTLDPAGEETVAYAYTGDRFMTIAYGVDGLKREDVVDSTITSIEGRQVEDGRMVVMASFADGRSAVMILDQTDTVALVSALSRMRQDERSTGA